MMLTESKNTLNTSSRDLNWVGRQFGITTSPFWRENAIIWNLTVQVKLLSKSHIIVVCTDLHMGNVAPNHALPFSTS